MGPCRGLELDWPGVRAGGLLLLHNPATNQRVPVIAWPLLTPGSNSASSIGHSSHGSKEEGEEFPPCYTSPIVRLNVGIALGERALLQLIPAAEVEEATALSLRPCMDAVSPSGRAQGGPDDLTSFCLYAREYLLDIGYAVAGMLLDLTLHGQNLRFRVANYTSLRTGQTSSDPANIFRVRKSTRVSLEAREEGPVSGRSVPLGPTEDHGTPAVRFADLGGLTEQITRLRELVDIPLFRPETCTRFGLPPPKGILLHGPPGTGKTMLARAVAAEAGVPVVSIHAADIASPYHGEGEAKLRRLFQQALDQAPSIIFLDELDTLCPKRELSTDAQLRLVTTLLALMDGLEGTGARGSVRHPRIVVIAATNRPNAMDEALRRPGRFDTELEVGIPNAAARREILLALLSRMCHDLRPEEVDELAAGTHGYVGADLAGICKEAGLCAMKRVLQGARMPGGQAPPALPPRVTVTLADMQAGRAFVRPSAMRELVLEVPTVRWEDIGGQHGTIRKLKEAIEWPLQHPEAFARFHIRPPKGILLYGPPGCSKTLMAKALATEAGLNFIAVKGPELFNKWVGESEKAVRDVFKKARAASPSIIFFDEIDALAVRRSSEETTVADRVLSQFLTELDGIEPLVHVTVVAATNRPDLIDPALLRPGRVDRILYVAPPDAASRADILRIQFRRSAVTPDVDVEELAALTDGFSGAEVAALCQEAAMCAMEEDVEAQHVARRHFLAALPGITPRIGPEMLQFYAAFQRTSGLQSI